MKLPFIVHYLPNALLEKSEKANLNDKGFLRWRVTFETKAFVTPTFFPSQNVESKKIENKAT